MADTTFSTPRSAGEQINSLTTLDRLAFSRALDLFSDALRADWRDFEARTDLTTPDGQIPGHSFATTWNSCTAALRFFRDMSAAHEYLREAAQHLLQTAGHLPDKLDATAPGAAISQLAECQKVGPGLARLLSDASHLLEACCGSISLMNLRLTVQPLSTPN